MALLLPLMCLEHGRSDSVGFCLATSPFMSHMVISLRGSHLFTHSPDLTLEWSGEGRLETWVSQKQEKVCFCEINRGHDYCERDIFHKHVSWSGI